MGKIIFSASAQQLALVAYVPADKAAKIDVTKWMEATIAPVGIWWGSGGDLVGI